MAHMVGYESLLKTHIESYEKYLEQLRQFVRIKYTLDLFIIRRCTLVDWFVLWADFQVGQTTF